MNKLILSVLLTSISGFSFAETAEVSPVVTEPKTASVVPVNHKIEIKPTVTAVVDVQYIFSEAKVAKDIKSQLEKERAKYQTQVSTKQKELSTKQKEIEALQGKISDAEYEKKSQAFTAEVAKINKDVNDKKVKLEQAAANALLEVEKIILSIIEKMSGEYGFNKADSMQMLVYTDPAANISYEVVKRLDAQLPKITIQVK